MERKEVYKHFKRQTRKQIRGLESETLSDKLNVF